MGVKDMWPILSPTETCLPLSALSGKTLAVDLSGWVCESHGARGLASAVKKPHIRNLLFRTLRLCQLGVKLVFVMDGTATQLKWETMDKREQGRGRGGGEGCGRARSRKTGSRPILDMNLRECASLLDALGLPCLQSCGEAEALCALLNITGLVDGVVTQDTDSFLYGATVVYKDISTDEKDPHVNCYSMEEIKGQLGLTRHDMVGMALLLGCDYDQGVPGIGKETVLRLVNACRSHDESCDLLQRYEHWKCHEFSLVQEIRQVEEQMYRKAKISADFPKKQVVDEYLSPKDKLPPLGALDWRMPDITVAMTMCLDKLDWPVEYSGKKLVTMATQWVIRKKAARSGLFDLPPISPSRVLHRRVKKGHAYYEVEWIGEVVNRIEAVMEGGCEGVMCTLEDAVQLETAYPELCRKFHEEQEIRKKGKKHTKKCVLPALKENRVETGVAVAKETGVAVAKACDVDGGDGGEDKWSKCNISRKGSGSDGRLMKDEGLDDGGEPWPGRGHEQELKPRREDGVPMKELSSNGLQPSRDGGLLVHKKHDGTLLMNRIPSKDPVKVSASAKRLPVEKAGDVTSLLGSKGHSTASASSDNRQPLEGDSGDVSDDDVLPLMMRLGRVAMGTRPAAATTCSAIPADGGSRTQPIVLD